MGLLSRFGFHPPVLNTGRLGDASRNFCYFFDRVPIASGGWYAQELLNLAQVTNRFHLPTIQTQDESLLDCNDP